jgi:hypothetical protein
MKKWNEENPGRAKEAMTQVHFFLSFLFLSTSFIFLLNRSRFCGKTHQRTLIAARDLKPANPRLQKNQKNQKHPENQKQRPRKRRRQRRLKLKMRTLRTAILLKPMMMRND